MNIDELITKYLTNESSADENAVLLDWVISNESNKKEFMQTCQVWYTTSNLHSKFDSNKAYHNFLEIKNKQLVLKKPRTIELWKKISAVAAIAILTIGVFFLFQESKPEQFTVANNNTNIKTVILSDGSQIFLNNGASVTYPEHFKDNARNISVSGTVFCNVTHNEKAPFSIASSAFSVEVLGTSFEVTTIAGKSHVIVESGKVKVAQNNSKNEFVIIKGERVDVTAKGFVKSRNNDVNFLSWKTGLLYFNKTSLKKVFVDLERHYNCKFIIDNESIYNENITGTYQDFSLTDIITIINSAFPRLEFTNIDSKTIKVSIKE